MLQGNKRHLTCGDLEEIDVFIPRFRKGRSKDQAKSLSLSPTKNHKKQILHKKDYVFLRREAGVAQLMAEDYRVVLVSEEIIPYQLQKGTSITLTIEIDQKRNTEKRKQLQEQQEQLAAEEDQLQQKVEG